MPIPATRLRCLIVALPWTLSWIGLSPLSAPAATQTTAVPTTVVLALCLAGSSPSCPASGVASPPVVASLTMYFGQMFNGTAVVSSADGSALDPTSTLTFYDSLNGVSTAICVISVVPGTQCPANVGSGEVGGTHILTAVYSGDAAHAGSTSNAVTIAVLPDTTTLTLASSLSPAQFGQAVTLSATMTGNFATPTSTTAGPVTFLSGSTVVGTGTFNAAGVATLTTTTLPVGTDPMTAVYAPTQNFLGSSSSVLNQIILPLFTSTTSLASSVNPSGFGQSVTFTATVAGVGVGSPVPSGVVTFSDGGTVLGTGALSGGVATYTTSALALGSHSISASFGGTSNISGSTSSALVQVVLAGSFTLTVTPALVSIGVGRSANLYVTVAETAGFSQTITLGCANLPTEASCTFGPVVIPAGGGSSSLLLATMAPHDCGSSAPYFAGSSGGWPATIPLGAPVLAGLAACGLCGRRRRLRGVLIAMLGTAAVVQMTGCGHCTDLGTQPGSYTVQVTATVTGGSAVASQNVLLRVTD